MRDIERKKKKKIEGRKNKGRAGRRVGGDEIDR